MMTKRLPDIKYTMKWVLFSCFLVIAASTIAILIVRPTDKLDFYVEPTLIEVGAITDRYVELTGSECFSGRNVRTISNETWKHSLGAQSAPSGYDAFYSVGQLSVEYSATPGSRNVLDRNGCYTFENFKQPIPPDLRIDLQNSCLPVVMYVELVIEAVDLDTKKRSNVVFWDSEAFTLEDSSCVDASNP